MNMGCSAPDMYKILLVLAFSSSVYSHNITSQMEGFIVGGQEVSIKHWPFITFIEAIMLNGDSSACGGSLLSSQTVLTAAHCLDDMTLKKKLHVKYKIYMGHSSFKKSRMVRSLKDYETHRSYDPESDDARGDIGIMFLNRPVTFIHNVQKTILVNQQFNSRKYKNLLVAGWGRVGTDKLSTISDNLKDVKLRSMSFYHCAKQIPLIRDIKKVVCAAPSHEFAYGGDSGGPLIERRTHYQLGLVSFRNQATGITVFTNVPAYYHWINRTNLNLYKKHCRKYKRPNY